MLKKKILKTRMLWKLAKKEDMLDMPSEEDIQIELKEMFKSVLLTEDRREQLLNLDAKSKWKLIKNHRKFLENNKESLRMVSSKEIMVVVNKIKTKASLVDLQEIKRWLLKATEFQVKSFCIYDGVKFLFQRLSEAEMVSRTNKNYRKTIEILKLLELLSKLDNGVQETLRCKHSVYYLLLNMHPYNIEVTSITLEILDNIIWESNVAIDIVLDSLTKIKNERNFQYRLYPFMQILKKSKNIMIISAMMTFINDFISAPTDENKRVSIRSEFLSSGIGEALEFIKEAIENDAYSIEDCTYEKVQRVLSKIKYDPDNFYFEEENSPLKSYISIMSPGSRSHIYDSPKKNIYDSPEGGSHVVLDPFAIKMHKLSKSISRPTQELEIDDIDFDRAEESQKIFERNFYLKLEDNAKFESQIEAILNQIDAFSKLSHIEKENKFLENLQKLLGKNKDVTDIKDLVEKIKENVLKRENFDTFLIVLQKFVLIPHTNTGDKLWAKLQRYIDNLIELNEEEEVQEKQVNKSTVEELESVLSIRDKEIRKYIEERNALLLKIDALTKSEKDLKGKLEIQANFAKNAHEQIKVTRKTIVQLENQIEEISPSGKDSPRGKKFSFGDEKKAEEDSKKQKQEPAEPLNLRCLLGLNQKPKPEEIQPPPIQPPPIHLLTGINLPEENKSNIQIPPPPPISLLGFETQQQSNQITAPPLGLLLGVPVTNFGVPPIGPPPLANLLAGISPQESQVGPPGPPSLNALLGIADPPGPPPLNALLGIAGPPGPPPLNALLGIAGPPGPPPLNALLGITGPPGPPPLNALLGIAGPPGPPPLGMLLGGPPGPPPIGMLLGGPPGPPPLGMLLGGPPGPPPIGNLLGGPMGPPPIGNLLGGPPPIGNLLGGPPPIGLLGKGIPGPPTFGFGGVASVVMKQKCKPRVPLRGVMWSLMKMNEIKNTIFEKINDANVKFDIDKLENEFQKKENTASVISSPIKPKIEKISLIKPERAKLFDIMMIKLKCSIPSIGNSLLIIDQNILSLNNLDLLLPAIPNEEEVHQCKSYKGDYELLANPEKLIIEISKVKGFGFRIKALHFQKIYQELVDDLNMKSDVLLKIWSSIRFDPRVEMLFEYVLAIGNYLNGTSNRGGAYGFKFDGLEKIADCKSTTNPKKNLLMFILDSIESTKKIPLILGNEDLGEYDLITKVPLNQLEIDLTDIRRGSKSVDQAILSQTDDPLDKITEKLQETGMALVKVIADLEVKLKKINEEFNETVKHFAEDKKDPSDVIGKKFYKMFQYCIHNKKELEKLRLMAKKESEKKMKEEQKKAAKAAMDLKSSSKPLEKKAIDGLTTFNRMESAMKNKNGEDILNDLAAKRENKKNKAIDESGGGNIAAMMSKKLKKNIEEENKEEFDNIKKDKVMGDLEKLLLQGSFGIKH